MGERAKRATEDERKIDCIKNTHEKSLPAAPDLEMVGIVAQNHHIQSPFNLAKLNLTHVVRERLLGNLDIEQAKQALDALNGTNKQE
jgi:hypothetical protein